MRRRLVPLLLASCSLAAQADGDLERGRMLFQTKCAICHSSAAEEGHAVGPNLHALVGRAIGSAEGFAYSPALGEAGGDWSAERLEHFPRIPGHGHARHQHAFLRPEEGRGSPLTDPLPAIPGT